MNKYAIFLMRQIQCKENPAMSTGVENEENSRLFYKIDDESYVMLGKYKLNPPMIEIGKIVVWKRWPD